MAKSKTDVDQANATFRRLDKPYFTDKNNYRQWLDEVERWAKEIPGTTPDDDVGHMLKSHILNAIKRLKLAINSNDTPEIMFCMHWLVMRMYDGEIVHSTNSLRIFSEAQKKGQGTKNKEREAFYKAVYNDYKNIGMSKETVMSDYDINSDTTFYRIVKKGKELQG